MIASLSKGRILVTCHLSLVTRRCVPTRRAVKGAGIPSPGWSMATPSGHPTPPMMSVYGLGDALMAPLWSGRGSRERLL